MKKRNVKIVILLIVGAILTYISFEIIGFVVVRISSFNGVKKMVEESNCEIWEEKLYINFEHDGIAYQECDFLSPIDYDNDSNEIIGYQLLSPWWTNGWKAAEIRKSSSLGNDVIYIGHLVSKDRPSDGYNVFASESLDLSTIEINFNEIIRYNKSSNKYLKNDIDYSYYITNSDFYDYKYTDSYRWSDDRICGIIGTINDDIEIRIDVFKTGQVYYMVFEYTKYYRMYEMEEELVNYLKQFSEFR